MNRFTRTLSAVLALALIAGFAGTALADVDTIVLGLDRMDRALATSAPRATPISVSAPSPEPADFLGDWSI